LNKEHSQQSRGHVESAIGEFRENMVRFTRTVTISYEELIHLVGTLINDEHIFYAVVEDIFTEALLEWQSTKNALAQTRIIRLTEIITSICELSSQDHVYGASHQNPLSRVLLDLQRHHTHREYVEGRRRLPR